MAADEGQVGGRRIAVSWQPGGKVLVQQQEFSRVKGIQNGSSTSGRAVVPGGREPRWVVGIEIAHNEDVVVRALEERAQIGKIAGGTGGSWRDIDIEDLQGVGPGCARMAWCSMVLSFGKRWSEGRSE